MLALGDGCDRSREEIPLAADLVRENALVGGVIRTPRRASGTESVAATPPERTVAHRRAVRIVCPMMYPRQLPEGRNMES